MEDFIERNMSFLSYEENNKNLKDINNIKFIYLVIPFICDLKEKFIFVDKESLNSFLEKNKTRNFMIEIYKYSDDGKFVFDVREEYKSKI